MNCIIIEDDELSRKIVEKYIAKVSYLNLLYSFSNPLEALQTVKENENIDLIFLDVEMPEMTGIEFIQSLKKTPGIIIISAKEKYAIVAFENDVIDYLLKPIVYPRFLKAVNKAYDHWKEHKNVAEVIDGIFIKKNAALVRLNYDEILWIEALENYISFNTLNEKTIIHSTMKAIESKLPANRFARVHRSFIVNLKKFNTIEDNTVVFNLGDASKVIPIGKSYREKLLRDINLLNT